MRPCPFRSFIRGPGFVPGLVFFFAFDLSCIRKTLVVSTRFWFVSSLSLAPPNRYHITDTTLDIHYLISHISYLFSVICHLLAETRFQHVIVLFPGGE